MADEWKQLDDSDVVDLLFDIKAARVELDIIDSFYPDADSLLSSGCASEAENLYEWLSYAEHLLEQCLIHSAERRAIHD